MSITTQSALDSDDMDCDTPRASGDRVGRYVLRRLLGRGGMGEVWVADDPLLAIPVALKVLVAEALGPVGSERLLREARAAAQLKHPAIVHVLDFGTSEAGDAYLAMELLDGETMADLVSRGPVAPELVASLLLPILDALAQAHARGLVHRDLKPENLFVARDDRGRITPKVLDFGIVQTARAGFRLTQVGRVVGTPQYMAPEQARADADLDGRVDLWAIAVTMFELSTGKLPFAGPSIPHLLTAILEQPAPSLAGVAGVDDEFAAIVARGLSKHRDDRFPDARAMGDALAAWLVARGVSEDARGTSLRAAWHGAAQAPRSVPPPAVSSREQRKEAPVATASPASPARLRAPARRLAGFAAVAAALAIGLAFWTLPRVAGASPVELGDEARGAQELELSVDVGGPVRPISTTIAVTRPESRPTARVVRRTWF